MAKLTLIELTNSSQHFGQSEYAMYLAQTENQEIIECGVTHNSLSRKGFDTDNLDSLVGCTVITKEYTDNRTGELVNPEDRIQMILDGDARLVLFNSVNSSIKKSELYVIEQRELLASTNAKAKVEFQKERKLQQKQASLERLRSRAVANMSKVADNQPSLDDDAETVPATEAPALEMTADDIDF
jgi:hypothetical protein